MSAAPRDAPAPNAHVPKTPKRRRFAWRKVLRALHRDVGYLVFGFTVLYAVSGLAVNHVADWDPSFTEFSERSDVTVPFVADDPTADRSEADVLAAEADDRAFAQRVLASLDVAEEPLDVYRSSADALDVVFSDRTYHLSPGDGGTHVHAEGQQPRVFLRIANWLHLNRGKASWTVFADAYAIGLLFLALSGLFMLKGKLGLLGRGGLLVALGAAIPVAYVLWVGGP